MKTLWVILLVAFVVFVVIYAILSRNNPSGEYRVRFFSRMPRERHTESNRQDSMYVAPVILGASADGAHAPASAPDCAPGVADAGGGCSAGADGGGATS